MNREINKTAKVEPCKKAIETLLELVKSGNERAFEQIVTLYEKQVFNMAMYMMKNREDAQDISQEVFVKLYRTIPNFRGDSSLKTYIMTLTRNACLDELRKKSRKEYVSLEHENEDNETETIDVPDNSDDANPSEYYLKKEKIEKVRKAIQSLNEDQREIILLRDINGLSYAEIAKITGLAEGTVKSRINRARIELKNLLTEWNYF